MTAQLLDSLPPFNLLCMGVSEVTGTFSKFIIKGVNIIDENQYQGTQQPNIINKCNFVAEDIIPMHTVPGGGGKFISVNSINSVNESMSKGKFNSSMNYNMEVTGSNLLDSISKDLNKE